MVLPNTGSHALRLSPPGPPPDTRPGPVPGTDEPTAAPRRRTASVNPVLRPDPDGVAARLGRTHGKRPLVLAVEMWIAALVVFTGALTAVGLVLVHWLTPGSLGRWEERTERWFFVERRPILNHLASAGTFLGSTATVIIAAAVVGAVFLARHRFAEFGLMLSALTLEASVFGVTQFFVERDRPSIPKLEQVAPTSSFPSGHFAATVALYGCLALIVWGRARRPWVRSGAWVAVAILAVWSAWSRLYRGAHHPTDMMASLVLGTAAIAMGVLIVRTVVAARHRTELAEDRP